MTDAPTKKTYTPFKRRQRRLLLLGIILPAFAGATALALVAVSQTQVYSFAPSALLAAPLAEIEGKTIRLGGLVAEGTLRGNDDTSVRFSITDGEMTIPVLYNDLLPGLVQEGEGVVAQGRLDANGVFIAENVLARHDENYMAPEVAAALKETGRYDEYIKEKGINK